MLPSSTFSRSDDQLRQIVAVKLVRFPPHHAVNVFFRFQAAAGQLALGQKLDILHLLGDGAGVRHDDLVGFLLAEVVKFLEHFVRRAEVERDGLVRVGEFL